VLYLNARVRAFVRRSALSPPRPPGNAALELKKPSQSPRSPQEFFVGPSALDDARVPHADRLRLDDSLLLPSHTVFRQYRNIQTNKLLMLPTDSFDPTTSQELRREPPQMEDCIPLIHGIIDAFLFLESSGPDEVNPDSAVRCMENISSSLLRLQHSDQLALRSHLATMADESTDPAYRDFVRALPDMIGLANHGTDC
jgi:hypothetical protein